MEFYQNFYAIKLEPIEIKSETGGGLLVGIAAQSIAGGQEFQDATGPISGSGVVKTEPTEIKSEPEADNQSVFYGLANNDRPAQSQSLETEFVKVETDWSTLYETKNSATIEENDKPELVKVPLPNVSPSEYTILESKRVQCNYCALSKDSIYKIRRHIRGMHRDKLYKCPFCPFTSKHPVTSHIKCKHKSVYEVKYFECYTCGRKFKFKTALASHVNSHRTAEELMQINEMYNCKHCSKTFRHKRSLIRHTKLCQSNTKKEVTEMQCDYCPYRCRSKHSLRYHIQKEHTPVAQLKTLTCPMCDFTTKFTVELNKHRAKYHRTRLQCDKCPYQTNHRANLTYHQMTHKKLRKKDKRFKCDKCDYRSTRLSHLKQHGLTHLKPEEIQHVYCYHCNFKCKYKSYLVVHMKRHFEQEEVEFECHICDFKTKKRQTYSHHIGEHL